MRKASEGGCGGYSWGAVMLLFCRSGHALDTCPCLNQGVVPFPQLPFHLWSELESFHNISIDQKNWKITYFTAAAQERRAATNLFQ